MKGGKERKGKDEEGKKGMGTQGRKGTERKGMGRTEKTGTERKDGQRKIRKVNKTAGWKGRDKKDTTETK